MILLHTLLLFSTFLPALLAPDRSQALSRINEARARILSNRARHRTNPARLTNHGRSSTTTRSKRQYGPEYPVGPYSYAPPPPPQPIPYEHFPYEDPDTELIHICSIEDDEYARSAESEEQSDDFHPFARDDDAPIAPHEVSFARMNEQEKTNFNNFPRIKEPRRKNDNFGLHGKARAGDDQWMEEPQGGQDFNKTVQELLDAQEKIERLEDELDSLREAEGVEGTSEVSPSEAVPSEPQPTEASPTSTVPPSQTTNTTESSKVEVPSSPWSPTPNGTPSQRGGIKKYTSEGGVPSETAKARDAEAHIHSRFHNRQHSIVHSHGTLPVSPSFHATSGFHVPQTHVVPMTPGLNVNINQNQNVHSGLNSGWQQSVVPHGSLINHGGVSSISHSLPSQSAIISTQTQPGFHLRHSGSPFDGNRGQMVSQNGFPHNQHQKLNGNSDGTSQSNFDQSHHVQFLQPQENNFEFQHQRDHHGSLRTGDETLGAAEDSKNEEPNDSLSEDTMSSWSSLREASPTHKKKMKKMKQQPYQAYPTYGSYSQHYGPNYGHYREAGEQEESDGMVAISSEDRAAHPTHHKKKRKKPQYYNHYREAEESDEDTIFENLVSPPEEREASPTHKKKQKFTTVYYPVYNKQPQYYGQSGHYREAEDENEDSTVGEEPTFSLAEDREASPTHHKKKNKYPPAYSPQPNYYPQPGHYREADDNSEQLRHGDDLEDLISSNYLFNFPAQRSNSGFKRSTAEDLDQILGQQRQIVDSLQNRSKNDEDLKLVADISNRTLSDLEEKRKKITKRSIPLTRLISDPKVKLDVPQTVENFGTATKNAFEDERAPMYHLKHMIGSSKNAVLSAMRIPPHNMIIPSDYEIVKTSERVGDSRGDDDDDTFSHTFRRVGQMVRNGIKSGHETAAHIGEVAYSAKNVLNTARHAAPRLIIPYSQIPAIQDAHKKRPNKAILITPRILDLAEETSSRKASDSRSNLVRLGHLMDAVGISKPNSKNLELQKIIFEPRGINEARVDERLAQLYSKFRHNYDDDVDTVSEAISTLEDAKISVGAKNLRDFLIKMRGELTNMVKGVPSEHKKKKATHKKKKQQETREMGRFIETLFDASKDQPKNEEAANVEKEKDGNDILGDRMFLSPELMHPFMGRASEADLKNFLRDNGDESLDNTGNILENQKESGFGSHKEELIKSTHDQHQNDSDLGYVLGAINPLMFERLYNQTVKVNQDEVTNPEELFHHQRKDEGPDGNRTVGTSFALTGPMLKPFMGEVQPQQIETFLDTYNRDEDSDFEQNDE